jgi:hypothetical protein
MARGLTALRAALGAVGGVTDALQERERMAREKERERKLLERQQAQDAASLRTEQRQAIDAGMIAADRFASMTMPGATPMQPTLRQKIGDTEYVYSPEVARAEKHRASVMGESLRRAETTREQTEKDRRITDLSVLARKKGPNSPEAALLASQSKAAFDATFPEPRQQAGGGLTAKQQQDRAQREGAAEALFNSPPDQETSDRLGRAFGRLRRAYTQRGVNKSPQSIMLEVAEGLDMMKPKKAEAVDPFAVVAGTPPIPYDKEKMWDTLRARPENKALSNDEITAMVERGMR